MAEIREVLASIEREIDQVLPEQAENRLKSLIHDLGKDDLLHWQSDIERLARLLLKKRERRVAEVLEDRLVAVGAKSRNVTFPMIEPSPVLDDTGEVMDWVEEEFSDLAQFHIFQWSTYYRDTINRVIEGLVEDLARGRQQNLDRLDQIVSAHVQEIFERGFQFKIEAQHRPEASAQLTAITGLQRFCELGIEYYSSASMKLRSSPQRISLRKVVSTFISSAIDGFSQSEFGSKTGAQLMAAHRIQWVHYLPFLERTDLEDFAVRMGDGSVSRMINSYLMPIVEAIDRSHRSSSVHIWLPQISQYFHDQRKIEIVVHAPKAKEQSPQIEIFALLDADLPALPVLREADSRNVSLIICALKADVAATAIAERLQRKLVDVYDGTEGDQQRRAAEIFKAAIAGSASGRSGDEQIEYNFARIFPLNNPFQAKYFHVVRKSVRSLLREMEGRNGVRLWCSVRRSGKTTACFDLDAFPGMEVIVQTCDNTHNDPTASLLFEEVTERLEIGRPLRKDFFKDAVESLRVSGSADGRTILILDEYETLFGRLKGAAKADADLKHSVVFPLLSQIVAFCRENMVVFVGQQPNAHYIFMEQNPISAYVKQDSFPLFSHQPGAAGSEFGDLVDKVLTDSWSPTAKFLDSLFAETAGHPFLTVNILVSLVDWLISRGARVKDVRFDLDLWESFTSSELVPNKIAVNTEYQFFLEAASDAMGALCRDSSPWLWAMYHSMRCFVQKFGAHGRSSVDEFVEMFSGAGLQVSGVSAEEILRTGADTNFFSIANSRVATCIPILARISAAATPRVN